VYIVPEFSGEYDKATRNEILIHGLPMKEREYTAGPKAQENFERMMIAGWID
jgi:hypothetical protein